MSPQLEWFCTGVGITCMVFVYTMGVGILTGFINVKGR